MPEALGSSLRRRYRGRGGREETRRGWRRGNAKRRGSRSRRGRQIVVPTDAKRKDFVMKDNKGNSQGRAGHLR